jgi:YcxB-like protein
MTVKGQITREEFLEFQRLHLRQSGFVDAVNVLGYFLLIALFLFLFATDSNLYGKCLYFLPFFAVILIVPIMRFVVLPMKWNQLYRQDKEISLPVEIELQDDGITILTELGKTIRPWTHYRKWKDNKALLILYLAENKATPFPKRYFSEKELAYIYERLNHCHIPKAPPITTPTLIFFIVFGLCVLVFIAAEVLRLLLFWIS